jgi:carboxyl-terminal processing protease
VAGELRPAFRGIRAARAGAGRILPGCALVLAICLAAQAPAPAAGRGKGFDSLGQQVVKLVREKFLDPEAAEAWAAAHDHYGAKAESRDTFVRLTRSALTELKTSHTGYYPLSDPRYYGLLSIFYESLGVRPVEVESIGADFTPEGFAENIFAGGPAEKAGLRRGDRVMEADGKPFEPVLSFRGRTGGEVILKVERSRGTPPENVAVIPRRIEPGKEWMEAQEKGTRLIHLDGETVGYVPLFSCAGEKFREALQEALGEKLREARALVLDFRNGWGGCNPDFVNLFNAAVPALSTAGRDGKERLLDSQWRGPLFVLINEGTRSGKEVVAYAVKKHRLGTLVGARTAGAVVGGSCFLLSDRSLLYLAVVDTRVDGERLEGVGVAPDVEVEDSLPYAAGADPQLDRALELAAKAGVEPPRRIGR